MFDFLIEGGLQFTLTLTALLLINILLIGRNTSFLYAGKFKNAAEANLLISYVLYLGVFTLTIGILGQLVGLYEAFIAIEQIGDISPALLAGGLRVSSITTLYGFGIFVFAYISWMLLKWKAKDYSNS